MAKKNKKHTVYYTYLIGWSWLDIWYYGSQYGKRAHPENLWTIYFTSSRHVKKFRAEHGDPDIIQIRKQDFGTSEATRLWEHKVLRRLGVMFNHRWLNKHDGNNKFATDVAGKKEFTNGTLTKKYFPGEEPSGWWQEGKPKHKGRQWWTDGTVYKLFLECPGEGWHRESPNKGRQCWTNGIEYVKTNECPGEGWHLKGSSSGMIWWNDGNRETMSRDRPGSDWVKGGLPNTNKGKNKGKKLWSNGEKQMYSYECPGPNWRRENNVKGKKLWSNGEKQMYSYECPGSDWQRGNSKTKGQQRWSNGEKRTWSHECPGPGWVPGWNIQEK